MIMQLPPIVKFSHTTHFATDRDIKLAVGACVKVHVFSKSTGWVEISKAQFLETAKCIAYQTIVNIDGKLYIS